MPFQKVFSHQNIKLFKLVKELVTDICVKRILNSLITFTMEADPPPQKIIHFYGKTEAYGFMSNFYHSPFTVGDKKYPTNEHYFQSKKFEGKEMENTIIQTPAPVEAFRLGRTANVPIREDW